MCLFKSQGKTTEGMEWSITPSVPLEKTHLGEIAQECAILGSDIFAPSVLQSYSDKDFE